ncbi:MAG: VWA domain-containing protein [Gammaproteobacteria bacterium]
MLSQILEFASTLRAAGIPADSRAAIDLCRGFEHLDVGNPNDFHAAARATFVYRREDLARFDEVFRRFWYRQERPHAPVADDAETARRRDPAAETRPPDEADDATGTNVEEQTTYSRDEIVGRKDLATLTDEEIETARRLLQAFIHRFARLRGRRHVRHGAAGRVDFRRMLRHVVASDAEALTLYYRRRKPQRPRLMILCDVSGSMEPYSRFLLEFIFALRRELPRTQVAVFATRMTVITDLMAARGVRDALRDVAARARDWGGGTDIGGCLRTFNLRYATDLVTSKSVVVLLSDGWDRGDAKLMSEEIRQLRRRANTLIWLNPLLGGKDYEPLTRGMQTALPHLDHFLPAHNLRSLANLAGTLQSLWR